MGKIFQGIQMDKSREFLKNITKILKYDKQISLTPLD